MVVFVATVETITFYPLHASCKIDWYVINAAQSVIDIVYIFGFTVWLLTAPGKPYHVNVEPRSVRSGLYIARFEYMT